MVLKYKGFFWTIKQGEQYVEKPKKIIVMLTGLFFVSSIYAYTERWGHGIGNPTAVEYLASLCEPGDWYVFSLDGGYEAPGRYIEDVTNGSVDEFNVGTLYAYGIFISPWSGSVCTTEQLKIIINYLDGGLIEGTKPTGRTGTKSVSNGTWSGICECSVIVQGQGRVVYREFPCGGTWEGDFTYDLRDPDQASAEGTATLTWTALNDPNIPDPVLRAGTSMSTPWTWEMTLDDWFE